METFNPFAHPICFTSPLRVVHSAWIEHVPFGMYLIDLLRPRVIVELGTARGISYCAFCQAVKEIGSDTKCYAIDTWQGDAHSGFYETEVLTDLRKHHDPLYGSFSRLVQGTFEDALPHFKDRSIDLLHIDGFHTYEAVKHDFDNWLPKLSEQGVVLFHDINVRERDFGVWKFWEELKSTYPSFEVMYGHGLGLISLNSHYPESLQLLFESSVADLVRIREFFYQLGLRVRHAQELNDLKELTVKQSIATSQTIENQAQIINALQEQVQTLSAREQNLQRLRTVRFLQAWSEQGAWFATRKSIQKVYQKLYFFL